MGNSITGHKEVINFPGESSSTVYEFGGFCPFGKVMNPAAIYAHREEYGNPNKSQIKDTRLTTSRSE